MYDQFYGLTGRPFQLTPDPQFYFESGTHRKALSYLGYGLAQGEGFIVITGEVGAGKSTLVGHLMQTIDKARLTAATIVTSQLNGNDMVQMAAESFGIHTQGQDKAATLKAIENFLHSEARSGRRCLLIVDEAQNLAIDAIEELRMLSNFQLGSQALLQIFLLGQPEFRDLVQGSAELEQLRQRIIATHHLEPMEADEVEPYIIHRLTRSGWNGRPQLTADAFAVLYSETNGVPRKLNTLMSRVLLMGAVEQLNIIDAALVKAVVADMAGKPFAYEAPMSAHGEVALPAAEPMIEEAFVDETVAEDVSAEPAYETIVLASVAKTDEAENLASFAAFEEPIAAAHVAEVTFEEAVTEEATFEEPISSKRLADVDHYYMDALAQRLTSLEHRVSEQDDALRRVLAMMIDWMGKETALEERFRQNSRAA
jgi:general secretion pathway protein A